jgi:peptidoglycan/xylan/chitin deacetylase (PgdA/CDA1 family)
LPGLCRGLMVELIFTLDYEIYGNGHGALRDLVIDPTQRLADVFREFKAPFVVFAEAVEFSKIEEAKSDPDSAGVRAQLRELRAVGHEIALHLHPWWANARYEDGTWDLDWNERVIGSLSSQRAEMIVSEAIAYLRGALKDPQFTPVAFRAGQWLLQPTPVIARILERHGIRIDSSVFKGGLMHGMGLDYRRAGANDGIWRFTDDVNVPDPEGKLWEIPILTDMVPFWRMLGRKRLRLQSKTRTASRGSPLPRSFRDFLRLRYPRKLDFCRLSFDEMRESIEKNLRRKHPEPRVYIAIGHSKDFVDIDAVRRFLKFLRDKEIGVTTFSNLLEEKAQLFKQCLP